MASFDDIEAFQDAWAQAYGRLAGLYSARLPPSGGWLVELGCGKGQLTVPLAEIALNFGIIGVDDYSGPYSRNLSSIRKALNRRGLARRVQVLVSDAIQWLQGQRELTYDAVVSSEFLPELDSKGMRCALRECHRVLRPGGITIHSFLSPIPRNESQSLLIEADSNPRWTKSPPAEWFSPQPDLVLRQMRSIGFDELRTATRKNNLRVRGSAARTLLESYGVKPSFWERHRERLTTAGLEMPNWIIVVGKKTMEPPKIR